MTLEEFVDSLAETENIEAQIWLKEFKDRIDQKQWQRLKDSPLERSLVIQFAAIMNSLIRERLDSICTEELYYSTTVSGHEFLREIYQKAIAQGIEVKENEIDSFLTYTEMMAAAGYIKVKDNKVTLTEKGEEAAESVAKEIAGS